MNHRYCSLVYLPISFLLFSFNEPLSVHTVPHRLQGAHEIPKHTNYTASNGMTYHGMVDQRRKCVASKQRNYLRIHLALHSRSLPAQYLCNCLHLHAVATHTNFFLLYFFLSIFLSLISRGMIKILLILT